MGACLSACPPRIRWCILGDDRKMNPNVAASDNVLAPQAPGEELRRQVDSPCPRGLLAPVFPLQPCLPFDGPWVLPPVFPPKPCQVFHGFRRQFFRQSRAEFCRKLDAAGVTFSVQVSEDFCCGIPDDLGCLAFHEIAQTLCF